MKKVRKLLALSLSVLMILVCFSACSGGDTTDESSSENASGDNYLNVMVEVEVASLDPQIATDGTSFEVIADYTDGLMQMDANGQAVNALAESYEVSEDGCTYTFNIRSDAKWSNGDDVTADDFVFGWQRAADPTVASEYSYMLSDIGQIKNAAQIISGEMPVTDLGVTAVDAKTLKVELNVPVSYFLSLMYFPTFYPVNRAFFNSLAEGTFGTSPETVLSNGAFILEEYQPAGLSFSLKKNPDYYDASKVSLDGLKYQVIKDSQTALLSYQQGNLDIVQLSGSQVEQVTGNAELKVTGAGYLWYIAFNNKDVAALGNVNMRLAISNAVNRASIVSEVVKDGSLATYTAVPPQFATGPDGKDFSLDQTKFAEYCSDDATKAKAYYDQACAELGTSTFTFELTVEDQQETQNVAAVIKSQIETNLPGVTINLKVEPKKQRVEDLQNGDFDVQLTRWGPDYADPMTYLGMWITDNSNNYGFWSDAQYDALIADCTTGQYISDATARWNALYDAELIAMQQAVIAPLYTKASANMIKSNVTGIEFHPVALNRVYKNTKKG